MPKTSKDTNYDEATQRRADNIIDFISHRLKPGQVTTLSEDPQVAAAMAELALIVQPKGDEPMKWTVEAARTPYEGLGITIASLASRPVWVGWKEEIRIDKSGKERKTKVPYSPKSGRKASSTAPSTWATRDEASKWVAKAHGDGVGLVLTQFDEMIVGGIDLDTCRDSVTGVIETWAQTVLDRFGTYAEVSPSGTGAKLFFVFAPVDLPAFKMALGNQGGRAFKRPNGTEHPPAIELYIEGRYFAVTEKAVNGINVFRSIDVADLQWLIRDHGPNFANQSKKASSASSQSNDNSRSAKAFRAGAALKRGGASYEEMREALLDHSDPEIYDWVNEKGLVNGERELHKIYDKARGPQQLPPWLATCEKDAKNQIIPNLANLMIALRCDPALADVFAFDRMLRAPVLRLALPAAPNGKTTGGTDPLPRPLRRRQRSARVCAALRLPAHHSRHLA